MGGYEGDGAGADTGEADSNDEADGGRADSHHTLQDARTLKLLFHDVAGAMNLATSTSQSKRYIIQN